MKDLIRKFYNNDVIRYLFFGGCTTLVNLAVFYVLRKMNVELNIANFISIVAAILFAYVVNSKYVFHYECRTLSDHLGPFARFIGARVLSMGVELGGVWLLVDRMGLKDMVGKVIVQVIVIILNYIFSKFFVFTKKKK